MKGKHRDYDDDYYYSSKNMGKMKGKGASIPLRVLEPVIRRFFLEQDLLYPANDIN